MISDPGDYTALEQNIKAFSEMNSEEYERISAKCFEISKNELNFDKQMSETIDFVSAIC